MSIHMAIHLSVHLSIHMCINMFIHMSICVHVCYVCRHMGSHVPIFASSASGGLVVAELSRDRVECGVGGG